MMHRVPVRQYASTGCGASFRILLILSTTSGVGAPENGRATKVSPSDSALARIAPMRGWSTPPSPSGRLATMVLNPEAAISATSSSLICGGDSKSFRNAANVGHNFVSLPVSSVLIGCRYKLRIAIRNAKRVHGSRDQIPFTCNGIAKKNVSSFQRAIRRIPWAYTFRRLLIAIPTMLAIITMAFLMMRAAPGGPFDGERKLPPATEAAIAAKFGLDKPAARAILQLCRRRAGWGFWPLLQDARQERE